MSPSWRSINGARWLFDPWSAKVNLGIQLGRAPPRTISNGQHTTLRLS